MNLQEKKQYLIGRHTEAAQAALHEHNNLKRKYELLGKSNAYGEAFYVICHGAGAEGSSGLLLQKKAEAEAAADKSWGEGLCEAMHKAEYEAYSEILTLFKED